MTHPIIPGRRRTRLLNMAILRILPVSLVLFVFLMGCTNQPSATAVVATPSVPADPGVIADTPTTAAVSTPAPEANPEASEPTPVATAGPSEPVPTAIACSGVSTSPQGEGPFYRSGSPERESLIDPGMPGTPILLFGRVFDADCNPIAGARLEFWLADVNGEYDNAGYGLRGHVFSNERGYYSLETIEPTAYTGRPPHIHAKVFAPDGEELLTTQIYFSGVDVPAEVQSAPELAAIYQDVDDLGRIGVLFNFVVQN